mmetsp:Transcript_42045/g.50962  ORF Transcript_42045/g.50962 Transcript_42045/m.50962 type:complete len:490 (-) Transcript_42045:482-1951(-)|eukprot:CAMPEP_0197864138 /NCGR_PEP_ID=MMETSP1438-20131217/42144_1 /TAXON_ID=1461541 /ORGANISM="Pterosperma sp., Strain CCMP1384" /LENGTH=489 /DNA_ID=CAMNT_0043482277 /DNA_START=106 /DNA_END=1575 /DNA_ORIENTATION=+
MLRATSIFKRACTQAAPRFMSSAASPKIVAPPMVYISGEEMTRYTMELIMDKWINPRIDTSAWEYYDLSCISRDQTKDKVLADAVEAGARIGAIFKEPTITPSAVQVKQLGLSKAWGSPNGAMRRGWNGITISRDTIHIKGIELGFKKPVLFERHAVGGEYGAGYKTVGKGRVTTIFYPEDGGPLVVVDDRKLSDDNNAVVTYHNPLDNVTDLAHHFFSRCLAEGVTPYVVTKKTVFKWQEGFWAAMKEVFDAEYKQKFVDAGLMGKCGGELVHLISDAATMQIIRWTDGGFGMAAHNYDGDMLTDEVAQVHRSPGFITSNLIGKRDDGVMIKEFEASHGTVADMWEAHKRGEETSMNPLGMVEALIGAMNHSAALQGGNEQVEEFTLKLRESMHKLMVAGQGTRDLCGPAGLTTEEFVQAVSDLLDGKVLEVDGVTEPVVDDELSEDQIAQLFKQFDKNEDGQINIKEFGRALRKLNVHPKEVEFCEV